MLDAQDFATVATAAPDAVVCDGTNLRLVLPFLVSGDDVRRATCVLGQAMDWSARSAPETMVRYAHDISSTWVRKGETLGPRGRKNALPLRFRPGRWKEGTGYIDILLQTVGFELYRDSGIGFLWVNLVPARKRTDLTAWLDFAQSARFLTTGRRPVILGDDAGQPPFLDLRQVFNFLHAELFGRQCPDGKVCLHTEDQTLVAGAWFIDNAPSSQESLIRHAVRSQLHSNSCLGTDQEEATGRPGYRLTYGRRQDFISTIDQTHFIAFDLPNDQFLRQTLRDHLDGVYFATYLFGLQERYFLLARIASLADEALNDDGLSTTKRFERIDRHAEALARFEARGYEHQLFQTEHHHRYWQAVGQTLDLAGLHGYLTGLLDRAMTRAESKRAAHDADRERHLERRIIVALAVPGIIIGTAGMNISGFTAGRDGASWLWAVLLLVLSVSIVVGVLLYRSDSAD